MNRRFHNFIWAFSFNDLGRQTRIPSTDASGLSDSDLPVDARSICDMLGSFYQSMSYDSNQPLAYKEYVGNNRDLDDQRLPEGRHVASKTDLLSVIQPCES